MKHTPGPWFITESAGDSDVPAGCSIGIDDAVGQDGIRDYFLATVVHGDPEELAANARLVAAAPDLLEALLDASHMIYGDYYYDHPTAVKVRSAIKKATGK